MSLSADYDILLSYQDTARAKLVRDALRSLALDPNVTRNEALHFGNLSYHITDVTAARLGRMLR